MLRAVEKCLKWGVAVHFEDIPTKIILYDFLCEAFNAGWIFGSNLLKNRPFSVRKLGSHAVDSDTSVIQFKMEASQHPKHSIYHLIRKWSEHGWITCNSIQFSLESYMKPDTFIPICNKTIAVRCAGRTIMRFVRSKYSSMNIHAFNIVRQMKPII